MVMLVVVCCAGRQAGQQTHLLSKRYWVKSDCITFGAVSSVLPAVALEFVALQFKSLAQPTIQSRLAVCNCISYCAQLTITCWLQLIDPSSRHVDVVPPPLFVLPSEIYWPPTNLPCMYVTCYNGSSSPPLNRQIDQLLTTLPWPRLGDR